MDLKEMIYIIMTMHLTPNNLNNANKIICVKSISNDGLDLAQVYICHIS